MLIEAGFDIAFECPAQTPMLLQLNVHPSRDADLLTPGQDRLGSAAPDARLSRSFRQSRHARRGSGGPCHLLQPLRHSRLGRPGRNAARCADDADRRSSRRNAAVPGSQADIATATSSPISPGRGSENCPAARASCRRSRISFTRKSASATRTRARPAAPAIPCTKASASAATSPISPLRSAAA